MGRDIKSTQRILDAQWVNLDDTSATNFDTLRTGTINKNLPFLFSFQPTTYPEQTRMYYLDQGEWRMEYTGSGQVRNAQIHAVANTVVDRSITLDQT